MSSAAAAASVRAAFLLSRFRDFSLKCYPSSSSKPFIGIARRDSRGIQEQRQSSCSVWRCLASGVDGGGGGGLADDIVSTAREQRRRRREYSALANVLCGIEPLDTVVIGEGVSAVAKEAMKRTISSMLGLLPSDQFHVAIRVSNQPLKRLLVSSVITGYTLWNAEYRLSLGKNFYKSPVIPGETFEEESVRLLNVEEELIEEKEAARELSEVPNPAALSYIQKLEAELAATEKELDAQLQEKKCMEYTRKDDSDLLEYLRSLEPDMVTELSQPSSPEVEEIIHQLVLSIHLKCFEDVLDSAGNSDKGKPSVDKRFPHCESDEDTMDTTRDYLAKLLFWCMLLGHHMRGLEYRLHLSFAVGLL